MLKKGGAGNNENGEELYDYQFEDEQKKKCAHKNGSEGTRLERMGIFKRLEIEPLHLLKLKPSAQEQLVGLKIGSEIRPEQIDKLILSSNKTATDIVNMENELDKMGIKFHDYYTGYYSHIPKADRFRLHKNLHDDDNPELHARKVSKKEL